MMVVFGRTAGRDTFTSWLRTTYFVSYSQIGGKPLENSQLRQARFVSMGNYRLLPVGFVFFFTISALGQNVGIGTTTPASKLDISGGLTIGSTYSGTNAAPANGALIEGSVGIGTTAPSVSLDVNGQIRMRNGAANGYIPVGNANGVMTWTDPATLLSGNTLDGAYDQGGAGMGRTITADAGVVSVQGKDGFEVLGVYDSGAAIGSPGSGTRMFFNPKKAAFRAGYVTGTKWDDANVGPFSVALGENTSASGSFSFAAGSFSFATGSHSVAMGSGSTALGNYSVAMGAGSTANGGSSTAIGGSVWAGGNGSVAIGDGASATGSSSVAIGDNVDANGVNSTAIGFSTLAFSDYSTALGNSTLANGQSSTALGNDTEASGNSSTAMGYQTIASGNYSTSMGDGTTASGVGSVSMGDATIAQGINSFAMGHSVTALSDYSIALGEFTSASAPYSFAAGYNSTASGGFSVAMGHNASASNAFSTSIGSNTSAAGDTSTALGSSSTASGTASTAFGSNTTASGNRSTAMGRNATASGNYSTAIGNNTEASGMSSTALGYNTLAQNTTSTAMGEQTQALGWASTALGYNTMASGDYSISMGGFTHASEWFSTAIGHLTLASGTTSFAAGESTVASGIHSMAAGYSSTASGNLAVAIGNTSVASGNYSVAIGDNLVAPSGYETVLGRFNTAYSPNSTPGWDAADRLFVLGNGTSAGAKSDAMVVLKNGNVGIGNSIPSFDLHVGDGILSATNGSDTRVVVSDNANSNRSAFITLAKDGSGNKIEGQFESDGQFNDAIIFGSSTSHPIYVRTGNTNRMYIGTTGNVGIGNTNPSVKLHVFNGTDAALGGGGYIQTGASTLVNVVIDNNEIMARNNGATSPLYIQNDGGETYFGDDVYALSFVTTSDSTAKEDIEEIDYGLEQVMQMRPVSYFIKSDENRKRRIGLIAQEVLPLISEVVRTIESYDEADDLGHKEFMALEYTALIPVLINSIQDQQALIESLQSQLLQVQNQLSKE